MLALDVYYLCASLVIVTTILNPLMNIYLLPPPQASELEDSRVVLSEMQSNYNRITDEKVALSRDLSKVSNELGELKVRTNRVSISVCLMCVYL